MPPYVEKISYDETERTERKVSICVYDELRPKHESNFLKKIRDAEKAVGFVTPLKWGNIIYLTVTHVTVLTWLVTYLFMGKLPKWQTFLYAVFIYQMGGIGVTAGVHRYWTHRSYKAKLQFQWILAICFSMAGQNTISDWVRDHRVHHKFSETSADPHDATRGFFFAHMGWLMMKKHPDVIREGRKIDMSDIDNDPVVRFHTKYFFVLRLVFCFLIPISIPPLMWGESWDQAILLQFFVGFIANLHTAWAVNSFAHIWGNRPYNPNINPSNNWMVSLFALGEGWHNYHHTFPWDYKASELPYFINLTTLVLDAFATIGWTYNTKQASQEVIQATKLRTHKS